MSTDIVLPNLSAWVQNGITAMYKATTDKDFNEAFDGFVAKDASITVNGRHMSRDQYQRMIRGEVHGDTSATLSFIDIVAVPSDSKDPNTIGTGSVGALFKATLFGRFMVLGHHQSNTVTSTMNVVVIKDPTIHHHQVGRGGAFDARRISNISEVMTDEQNRITVPPRQPPPA